MAKSKETDLQIPGCGQWQLRVEKLQVPSRATLLDARSYIEVARDQEKAEALKLEASVKGADVVVPPIEVVAAKATTLASTEARYLLQFDAEEPAGIARREEAVGDFGKVRVRLPPQYEGKTRLRHFEVSIKP